MSVVPVNIGRVSQNLRSTTVLNTLRATQFSMFRAQNQLSTGLRFQRPSEDVVSAAAALRIDRRLGILEQVRENLNAANAVLGEAEAGVQDAMNLLTDANALALQAVGDSTTPDERSALATTVDAMIDQLIAIGNREHLDTFLFSGHFSGAPPFTLTADGVLFRGDFGRLQTTLDSDLSQTQFTISGADFFRAVSGAVQGRVDLNPALTLETRVQDLAGATGNGVDLGRIVIDNGSEQTIVDLSGSATVGDIIDKLNAAAPSNVRASITATSIVLDWVGTGPGQITVADVEGGTTATDLGIFGSNPSNQIIGVDLNPRLTRLTPLSVLNLGAGVDLSAGLVIRNGAQVANIDFSGAETFEDVLDRIQQADVGVLAEINAAANGINVRNRISGSELRIEESGGTAAAQLGIRTMDGATRLAELNDGRGVHTVAGDDFAITTADGTQIAIDLDALDLATATLDDVIVLLNTAGGGAFTASLATSGSGLVLTDNTAGAGALSVAAVNYATTLSDLGLDVPPTGPTLIGQDVNPAIVDGPFTALVELRDALLSDDARRISDAAERLQRVLPEMQRVQGRLAALASQMLDRQNRLESEATFHQVLLSDVRDADVTETVVKFQQAQTALQANLATAGQILNLSLLNYL